MWGNFRHFNFTCIIQHLFMHKYIKCSMAIVTHSACVCVLYTVSVHVVYVPATRDDKYNQSTAIKIMPRKFIQFSVHKEIWMSLPYTELTWLGDRSQYFRCVRCIVYHPITFNRTHRFLNGFASIFQTPAHPDGIRAHRNWWQMASHRNGIVMMPFSIENDQPNCDAELYSLVSLFCANLKLSLCSVLPTAVISIPQDGL